MTSSDTSSIFLPPVNRSMRELDRSFFQKTVTLSALTVFDNRNLSSTRDALKKSGDLFDIFSIRVTRDDDQGKKCILLKPSVNADDTRTWSATITELVKNETGYVRPYQLHLNYDHWNMQEILEAILPELPEDERETPAGFASVGHVAHVNIREKYRPYRHTIAQVIVDKNPNIKTVINKTEDVGTESIFRTFPYEVLAGPDNLDVEVSESNCIFRFNFGKVYWNSRLNTEHKRLMSKFKEGEAVCDAMAGVGPFAVPAGKNRVFVSANDLNPDSFSALCWAVRKNKVEDFVRTSCEDARRFIRRATEELQSNRRREVRLHRRKLKALPRSATEEEKRRRDEEERENIYTLREPASFDHYIMNLPASAVEFLDAFPGLYARRENEFTPTTTRRLPMVHVYLFIQKMDSEEEEHRAVCEKVSKHLGAEILPGTEGVELWDVRLVSPKKKMYCASFRLPPEIAFAAKITNDGC